MIELPGSELPRIDIEQAAKTVLQDKALEEALGRIPSSFDRLQEAHFWIHGLERHYHHYSPFRWNLSAFLKSLKEIIQLLQFEMQNEPGFADWFAPRRRELREDPLIAFLSDERNTVVHKRMILPDSKCFVGITELRGLKIGMCLDTDAQRDSDDVMHHYLCAVAEGVEDFLGVLMEDEESVPCVKREWRLTGFDDEVIDLASQAWLRTGETVAAVLEWMGVKPPPLSLDCRHGDQEVKFKLFKREDLHSMLGEIRGRSTNAGLKSGPDS